MRARWHGSECSTAEGAAWRAAARTADTFKSCGARRKAVRRAQGVHASLDLRGRLAADLRLHANVGELLARRETRLAVVQRIFDLVECIAQAGDGTLRPVDKQYRSSRGIRAGIKERLAENRSVGGGSYEVAIHPLRRTVTMYYDKHAVAEVQQAFTIPVITTRGKFMEMEEERAILSAAVRNEPTERASHERALRRAKANVRR